MQGLRWREWGWVEMAWMLHKRNVAQIGQHQKSQMRKYLQQTRDFELLTIWDNQQMSDKLSDT